MKWGLWLNRKEAIGLKALGTFMGHSAASGGDPAYELAEAMRTPGETAQEVIESFRLERLKQQALAAARQGKA